MKRKFKFMSTVASLSLAVALLVFGVVAAVADRRVEINGSVSFTAVNVNALVTVAVTHGKVTAPASWDVLEGSQSASFQYELDGSQDGHNVTLSDHDFSETEKAGEGVNLYIVTITIENTFDGDVGIKVTYELPTDPALAGLTFTPNALRDGANFTSGTTLNSEETVVLTMRYSLNPEAALNIDEHPIEPWISLERVTTAPDGE